MNNTSFMHEESFRKGFRPNPIEGSGSIGGGGGNYSFNHLGGGAIHPKRVNNNTSSSSLRLQGLNENEQLAQPTVNSRIFYLTKLYTAVLLQLLIIGGFAYCVHDIPELRAHLAKNEAYFYVAIIGCLLIAIYTGSFRQAVKKSPMNIVCFTIWTICFGVTLVYILSVRKESIIGIMSLSLLAAIVASQLIYTLTVRYELTYQGSTLFVFGAQLIVFHIFTIFSQISLLTMATISFFGFLFAFYFIFDTQSRIAGSDYDFSSDEWMSGAVLIYIDVLLLFLRIGTLLTNMLTKPAQE